MVTKLLLTRKVKEETCYLMELRFHIRAIVSSNSPVKRLDQQNYKSQSSKFCVDFYAYGNALSCKMLISLSSKTKYDFCCKYNTH